MDLPVVNQWSLLDRILAYDRTFSDRTEDGLVVGIVYQRSNRASVLAHDEVREAARTLDGRVLAGITLVSIEASTAAELAERLRAEQVDLLYVAPMRAYDIGNVAAAAAEVRVPSFTGVRAYLPVGVGLCVGQRGGTPEILVNLAATRLQGMDLSAQLLRLATVLEARGREEAPPAAAHP
jgi:hypothetical protein